jgi:hypothetical protein
MGKYLLLIKTSNNHFIPPNFITNFLELISCVQADFVNNVARFDTIKFGKVVGEIFGVSVFGINKLGVRTFAPWRL